jgi:LPXTG-site transpeptidase (sortase) family protein
MYNRKRRHPWVLLILIGLFAGVWASRGYFFPAAPDVMSTDVPPTVVEPIQSPTDAPQPTIMLVDATATAIPEAVAVLSMPRLNISARVVEKYLNGSGWDISLLGRNIGHLEGTSTLHGGGNTVLVGHVELADGEFGPFHDIATLAVGDKVILLVGAESESYTVSDIYETTPDDMNPLRPTTTSRLTLITCGDYNFISNIYESRIIVVADKNV